MCVYIYIIMDHLSHISTYHEHPPGSPTMTSAAWSVGLALEIWAFRLKPLAAMAAMAAAARNHRMVL